MRLGLGPFAMSLRRSTRVLQLGLATLNTQRHTAQQGVCVLSCVVKPYIVFAPFDSIRYALLAREQGGPSMRCSSIQRLGGTEDVDGLILYPTPALPSFSYTSETPKAGGPLVKWTGMGQRERGVRKVFFFLKSNPSDRGTGRSHRSLTWPQEKQRNRGQRRRRS